MCFSLPMFCVVLVPVISGLRCGMVLALGFGVLR
jgi:hypothetical protein